MGYMIEVIVHRCLFSFGLCGDVVPHSDYHCHLLPLWIIFVIAYIVWYIVVRYFEWQRLVLASRDLYFILYTTSEMSSLNIRPKTPAWSNLSEGNVFFNSGINMDVFMFFFFFTIFKRLSGYILLSRLIKNKFFVILANSLGLLDTGESLISFPVRFSCILLLHPDTLFVAIKVV